LEEKNLAYLSHYSQKKRKKLDENGYVQVFPSLSVPLTHISLKSILFHEYRFVGGIENPFEEGSS